MIIGLRPRTPPGTDRARRAPAETQRTTGQAVIGAGPAGAGLLYDSRRGVYYAKPLLRGWLHLLCFFVSLAGGALLLAGAHEPARRTAPRRRRSSTRVRRNRSASRGKRTGMFQAASIREWRGRDVVDAQGHKIGELEAVYVDTATDLPSFGTVTIGMPTRHRLVFVPLDHA